MVPFASWPVGALAWEALVVGMFMIGLWAVVRQGWPDHPLPAFGLALTLAATVPQLGVLEGVALGNVNLATAGLVGLVWTGSRGVVPAIGLMTVIKVFPYALSAPLGLRAMARAGAIAGAICLVTLPLVGIGSWVDYFVALGRSVPLCGDPQWSNASLACALGPYTSTEVAKSASHRWHSGRHSGAGRPLVRGHHGCRSRYLGTSHGTPRALPRDPVRSGLDHAALQPLG